MTTKRSIEKNSVTIHPYKFSSDPWSPNRFERKKYLLSLGDINPCGHIVCIVPASQAWAVYDYLQGGRAPHAWHAMSRAELEHNTIDGQNSRCMQSARLVVATSSLLVQQRSSISSRSSLVEFSILSNIKQKLVLVFVFFFIFRYQHYRCSVVVPVITAG